MMFEENYKLNTFTVELLEKKIFHIHERSDVYSHVLILALQTRI